MSVPFLTSDVVYRPNPAVLLSFRMISFHKFVYGPVPKYVPSGGSSLSDPSPESAVVCPVGFERAILHNILTGLCNRCSAAVIFNRCLFHLSPGQGSDRGFRSRLQIAASD